MPELIDFRDRLEDHIRELFGCIDDILDELGYCQPTDWLLAPFEKPKDRLRALYRKIDPIILSEMHVLASRAERVVLW